MQVIYLLSDPITKKPRYVGATNNFNKRIREHIMGRNSGHCHYWVKCLLKSKLEPEASILEEVTEEQRSDAEIKWISYFRKLGEDLTNLTDGGEGSLGYKHTEEFKDKIRKIQIGNKNSVGRILTEEHKKRISQFNKEKIVSEETRKKQSENMKKRIYTEETKAKMRLAAKNRPPPNKETRMKISLKAKGRTLSEEHKRRVAVANSKRVISEESRQRMRESQRKRWIRVEL